MRLLLLVVALSASASAQPRSVTFQVNVGYQIEQGLFDPATESVDVAGTFNNWGASPRTPLADPDGDGTYEVTVGGFTVGQTAEFKFRYNGQWDGREEFAGGGPNRTYTVQAGANVVSVWYNDEQPPTGPPSAAFTAAPQSVTEGGLAYFTDRSGGEVATWSWTFEGGLPATSTDRHPAVRYAQAGTYDVTLVASGPEGSDTLAVADYVVVRPRPEGVLAWWNDAVFYEVFVRSFADSDGDGVGDLAGLTSRLDYLNDGDPATTDDLGVTGIWLMPISPSPSYHGYDVTDYEAVEPDYGSLADLRQFLDEAHARGIRVVVDFVMNHSSDQHPWFQAALRNEAPYRDFYRWSPTRPAYLGPWGQEVWHSRTGAYNYGIFARGMPDLNFGTPAVRDSLFAAADFWLRDVGVDGFRLDAVRYIMEEGPVLLDLPATHQFLAAFGDHVDAADPEAYTVCEAWGATDIVVPYLTEGRLDTCFEFDLATAMLGAVNTGDARALAAQMQEVYDAYPHLQYATFLTNHDQDRVMSVVGQNEGKARAAAALLLTLPGVPYLYYGEE
ncbi:MAG TPA: alpha-amylase family glycosyl hydrolase, partial [Rubricoccaceae bacterium]